MKTQILLYTIILSLISSAGWTQRLFLNQKKMVLTPNQIIVIEEETNKLNMYIKYYHVEEIVKIKFGGYKTIYDVTNLKLIETYDLGPNNKRIITPIYSTEKRLEKTDLKSKTITKIGTPPHTSASDLPKKTETYSYIDIITIYEKAVDKGYESIDMMKKIGDSYFFNQELEKAEKYYTKLFSLTNELELVYYYRYAMSLKSIGNSEKSDELFKKYNQLSVSAFKQ